MGKYKSLRIKALFIGVLIITQSMIYTGCDKNRNLEVEASYTPQVTAAKDIQVKVGEKDEYGGTVIAIDKFDNNFNIGTLTSISKDGRHYLFQLDPYDFKTHEPSDKARLVIWDSVDKKVIASIEGKIAAAYMRNSVLDMENKRVYYGDMNSINYIDFNQKEKVDILSKYKIQPGDEFMDKSGNLQYNVGFLAFDKGTLFVNIRTQKDPDNTDYSLYQIKDEKCKKINIEIKEKISFMEVLGVIEGSRLMCQINSKFYITDLDGNVIEERPLIENKDFKVLGSSYMYPSYDGKKLLYSLGKTPTDLYMYDFETKEFKVLCPSGLNDLGVNIPSIREKYGDCEGCFWAGNDRVIAKIGLGEILFGGMRTVIAKEYKID
ncbi:hypothetical protein [Pseudobacteroides cellulosolvens]|uniref:Uncharacterized protein n=1 Tax=Pseudobacteroides cellulosolvens ATCC 35603 = DSM 2933 TaxID=398512 RepID=A0A0L6JIK2_9FIRM|nr:hypothetical protein [Pseudobacteroides cellulosolvens]KNY25569.1 hypothetical protein Bccel_0829 [Pseudobacteroides cellulosolvens ATCC 35603 = DSM 2933]